MEVILRQDVNEVGLEGDIVKVARGYARNYLIPRGYALESTPQNIKNLALQRKKIEAKRLKAKEAAEDLKKQIEALEITFKHKAGDEGKLYGAVTGKEIAAFLEDKGVVIDRKKIILEKPIKELGEFSIKVRLYPKVTALIKGSVVPETEE